MTSLPMLRAASRVCSLRPADAVARIAEVRDFLGRTGEIMSIPDGVRLEFQSTAANRSAVDRFVAAERECCARFRYEVLELPAPRLVLEIKAEPRDLHDLRALYHGEART